MQRGFTGTLVILKCISVKTPLEQDPVSGKWMLAKDFVAYEHSSASFYEDGKALHFTPKHFRDI